MRVFAGPNGSGKSTILEQIDSKFDTGYCVNADEIEKHLKAKGAFDLSSFGIANFSMAKFQELLREHTIVKKTKSDGYVTAP